MKISHELQVGQAGEYLTLCDLLMKGVTAFSTDAGIPYDVVVDTGDCLLRLQVKTSAAMYGPGERNIKQPGVVYFYHIKRAGRGSSRYYSRGEFDGWALAMLDIRQVAYLPWDDRISKASITLRDRNYSYGKWKNDMRGWYWQDLTWENFINAMAT